MLPYSYSILRHAQIPQHKICPAHYFGASKGFEVEEISEKIEMRIYSEIGFAYIDENGKMKNAIGIQMDEGNPIVIKKLAQKGMRRQSKSSTVKIFKNNTAHKMKTCGARHCSAHAARHPGDTLKIA